MPLNVIIAGSLFLITAAVLYISYYSARHTEIPGAGEFSVLCLLSSFYTFGYAMELLSSTLVQVDFWSKFQYIGLSYVPAVWVLLSLAFSGADLRHRRTFTAILLTIPSLTLLFRATSGWLGLHYGAMSLVSNGYFDVLVFEKGPWYYVHIVYFFACVAYAFYNYTRVSVGAIGYMRRQAVIMILASFLPVVAIVLNVAELAPLGLDCGPFTVIANYILFSFGLFRYSREHLLPLSRNKVFDWMQDGVLVLTTRNKIFDYNTAASRIFSELTPGSVGSKVDVCLKDYADFIEKLKQQLHASIESVPASEWPKKSFDELSGFGFSLEGDEVRSTRHFQVRLSALHVSGGLVGTTVLISDVTAQHEMLQALEQSARTDGMTGLMNRDYLIERIQYEIDRAGREGSDVALAIFDIDHFKEINDTFGHQAGDHAIRQLAVSVLENVRTIDLVGRYGGDEFVIFLPDTGIEEAAAVAERVRAGFEARDILWTGSRLRLTASFGVASAHARTRDPQALRSAHNGEDEHRKPAAAIDYDDLVRRADQALYRAKSAGRNRVERAAANDRH